jgi:cellulase (glycosyl hydrolase family 5)
MKPWPCVTLSLLACATTPTRSPSPPTIDWVELSPDAHSFVSSRTRAPFTPWGFNYDHDTRVPPRLIEDYWTAEWPKVARDFHAMREMGATLVRVPLQLSRVMRSPDDVNPDSLERVRRLLAVAESEGLHLDLTGLANFRPEDVPPWYGALSEADRWRTQARFWEAIAEQSAGSPAVFCFNLMNEPAVPSGAQAGWFAPPWTDGRTYIEYLAKDAGARSRAEIGRQWLRTMARAIRRHDGRHLITVGSFTVFDQAENLAIGLTPRELAAEVDFLSLHLYPNSSRLDAARAVIGQMSTGKPLLLEESGPLQCSLDQLRGLMVQSRGEVAGWMGFYWGETPDEYRRSGKLEDALMADWIELVRDLSPARL